MKPLHLVPALALAARSVLAALPAAAQDVLVPRGSVWSYLDDGSEQGAAWRAASFDDSGWARGPAQLGFGDGDERTLVSYGGAPAQKHVTTYFRHAFTVADPAAYRSLELRLLRDDGAVVHLNGVEVARDNLPAGILRATTTALEHTYEADEAAFRPTLLPLAGLVAGVNVLAVEVHLASVSSDDLSFDLELLGAAGPLLRRGPYLQKVGPDRFVVRWQTSTPVVGELRWGPAPGALSQAVQEPGATTKHRLEVVGLAPLTDVVYAVGDATGATLAGDDPRHRFRTGPPAGARIPFRAWVLGDSGTANADSARVRDAYRAYAAADPADLLLLLGDNAYPWGTDIEYQAALFDTYADELRRTPLWPSIGNHEQDRSVYLDLFSLPRNGEVGGVSSGVEEYHSFDWANAHFVCLDSYSSDRSVGGPMWSWCRADLAATTADWVIAYFHHPPYSRGGHDSDVEPWMVEMRENFGPLLEAGGVSLVLCGHSHGYERSHLIDGHYGPSTTFDATRMLVDGGDGRIGGSGPYRRPPGPRLGTVYVVAGSSGKLSPGPFDHPTTCCAALELGSLVLDVCGGRLDVAFLTDQGTVLDDFTLLDPTWDGRYGVGAVDGEGCVATLRAVGVPSVSSGQPFEVRAEGLRSGSFGLLFYGLAADDGGPLAGGRLAVAPPLWRTAPGFSGGAAPCSGVLGVDFAPLWNQPAHPGLVPGATVHCQFWHRDTTPPGSSLTEALAFIVQP